MNRLRALLIFAALAIAVVATAPGCTSPDGYKTFVAAADVAANETIGPRYTAYVQADQSLSTEEKITYINELSAFRAAVAEAKKDGASP